VKNRCISPLRCGGIVNDDFVAYLLVNLSVKIFENRSTFGEVMDNIVVPCFFDSQCRKADLDLKLQMK